MSGVHVLHVVPGLSPGGMELTMARVISGLTDDKTRHSVACLKGEPEIADRLPASTEIHCLRSRPNELELPLRLARLIGRVRPTVIHARNWGAWPEVSVGRLLVRPVVPLILSFHGLGQAGYMPWRRRIASRMLARMVTGLLAVSEQSKQLMVARWGWPEQRVEVIPNGVDTDRFHPGGRLGDRPRLIVGTVGNLRAVKNHSLLLRACGALLRQGTDLEVRIAGEGEERDRLVALADSLGLADRLDLPGRVDDVPGFLQDLDVFVLSSDSEQHPNALNEAMACGIACVATRVGCVSELLDEGRCGKIVTPGSTDEMVDALAKMLSDPGLRREYGASARRRACDRYSQVRMLAAYGALYARFSSSRESRR